MTTDILRIRFDAPICQGVCGIKPVFVHSSWRTSSTWFWTKLRQSPHVIAFCEYFHESLATMDMKNASGSTYKSWDSKHPDSAAYFLEFMPLLRDSGGVPFYDMSMAIDRFIPEDGIIGKLSGAEVAYLDSLLKYSASHNKIPVLTCTRSLGRARAIKNSYPCTAILQYRNIFHQWASASSLFMNGNTYFLNSINDIIKKNRHDKFFRLIDDAFTMRTVSADDEGMFSAFILFHLYAYSNAFDFCDLSIDVNQIATNRNYREHAESSLSSIVLSPIDMSDVKIDFQISSVHVSSSVVFRDTIDQFEKIVCPVDASEECYAFTRRLKEQCIEEWERHEFYTRGARTYLRTKEMKLTNEINEKLVQLTLAQERYVESEKERNLLSSRVMLAVAECDEVARRLHETTTELNDLSAQVAGLVFERDNLSSQVNAMTAERDSLAAHVAAATEERDELVRRLHDESKERNDFSEQVAGMILERDSLAAQVATVTTERNSLVAHVAAVAAERDGLSSQVATVIAELSDVAKRLCALADERDSFASEIANAETERQRLSELLKAVTEERDALLERQWKSRPFWLSRLRE